ncbi:glycoside hydrolase family 3 protein [Tessaracoccus antarcticus]|uniref:Beta-glucosidase n=1 Tax=Tessaracoccus antarcticus TaxID=2479848 RepID=A0A3M0G5R0_9ACTN|nr:glycoside hydrolase family 3 protein [Tessaracoccus antarcticus]RMB59898.1 beta-glucosidase [Tessaracoccus antarcticus]
MKQHLKSAFGRIAHRFVNGVTQMSTDVVGGDTSVEPALASLCRQAATEGIVLLRNDGTLPLAGGARVAVFGRVQNNWFTVGYGSGGDVKPPYRVSLMDALGEVDAVHVDDQLASAYRVWCADNVPDEGFWAHWPRHFEEMPLTAELVAGAAERCDVAVVVLGRAAGEDRENVLEQGSYYLTDAERHMCDAVMARFEHTVLMVNTGNVMDLSWAESYGDRLGALVLAWQGGMESAHALADVLVGAASPSGRLTSTIARRYKDYPSARHFGDRNFSNYVEDVYVGYRYFETFAPDAVLYPFGHGLSYTSFSITTTACDVVDGEVRVDVDVHNTGVHHTARQVVQLYFNAPDGPLGTPSRVLAAFAKTADLAPGETQSLQLGFAVDQMASYDDAGATGHRSAWILQPGSYEFFVGSDVRSAGRVGSYSVEELRVVQQLEEACAVEPGRRFDRMAAVRDAEGGTRLGWEATPERTVDLRRRILDTLPSALPALAADVVWRLQDVADGNASLEAFVAQLSLEELEALSRGDLRMNSPLGAPGNAGVLGGVTESLRRKGVVPVTCTDGPSGIRLSEHAALLPCGTALASSWNVDLISELASEHGREMIRKGSDVLLSPGMNIHRDPLCGRNFEYFSEDPLLTGRMGAAVVTGVQSQGVSACPKHFAANNQETNRTKHDSRVSERALREIYLRGFEICIAEAAPHTIMTSYNKINGVWAHYNHELVTTILRDQWGYDGLVMTDWWMQPSRDPNFPALWDSAYRVRAQVDVLMPGSTIGGLRRGYDRSLLRSHARPEGITLGELQRTATNVLSFVLVSRPFTTGRVTA